MDLAVFGVGELIGGWLMAGVIVVVGVHLVIPSTIAYAVLRNGLSIVAFAYGATSLMGIKLRVPSSHWLVPKGWSSYGGLIAPFLFGVPLGTGCATVVPFIGYYLFVGASVMAGSWVIAFLAMTIFAFTRWVPVAATGFVLGLRGEGMHLDQLNKLRRLFGELELFVALPRTALVLAFGVLFLFNR